jgi:flagellar P-ring protein precursor FlgI
MVMNGFKQLTVLALAGLAMMTALPAHADRIKDVAGISGVRNNQLVGYGIVVGLDGTGDQTTQTPFTVQSIQSMLGQLGVNLPPGQSLQLKNVAAAMVTAVLPPFAQPGQPLDITVSSMGNAKSLKGGTLLLTPLKGADGQIYAMAQGNIVVAGAGASSGGSKAQVNHLAAGRIPAGATVERIVESPFANADKLKLELFSGDFSVARRVAAAINNQIGTGTARALDARNIEVKVPEGAEARVAFMADIENLVIDSTGAAARIIVNARTGSVVMNQAVTLEPAAVAHGNLSVTISSSPVVSQPNALGQGQTVVAEKTDIQIKQDDGKIILLPAGAKLTDVVKALNTLGVTPQDLLAILQAMKAAGALRADLEII